jgi:hypothetical protein
MGSQVGVEQRKQFVEAAFDVVAKEEPSPTVAVFLYLISIFWDKELVAWEDVEAFLEKSEAPPVSNPASETLKKLLADRIAPKDFKKFPIRKCRSFMGSDKTAPIRDWLAAASKKVGFDLVLVTQDDAKELVLKPPPRTSPNASSRARDPLFDELLEKSENTAKASQVLAFANANQAYSALEGFIRHSRPGELVEAELVQHSCTFSKGVVMALHEKGVKTTVYVQDRDIIEKILGNLGIFHHSSSAPNLKQTCTEMTWRFYKPIASLSAIWIKRCDGRCVLLLSWYVYRSLRWHELDQQERAATRAKTSRNRPTAYEEKEEEARKKDTDEETGQINKHLQKIYGHAEPAFIILDRAPGYDYFYNNFFVRHEDDKCNVQVKQLDFELDHEAALSRNEGDAGAIPET